jgi:hypothetical protein
MESGEIVAAVLQRNGLTVSRKAPAVLESGTAMPRPDALTLST